MIAQTEWPKYKNGLSEPAALALFKKDLAPFVNTVRQSVSANITQNEFDALVILVFNIGEPRFKKSSVLKLVNDPTAKTEFTSLEKAWKAWNKSQGVVNRGLKNRRDAEWDIYSKNIYKKWYS